MAGWRHCGWSSLAGDDLFWLCRPAKPITLVIFLFCDAEVVQDNEREGTVCDQGYCKRNKNRLLLVMCFKDLLAVVRSR